MMKMIYGLVLTIALVPLTDVSSSEAQIVGEAVVIDGDTIEIGSVRVRFFGIDAPEKRQTCFTASAIPYKCGQRSTAYLRKMIGSAFVSCEDLGQAKFGRRWGRCFVRDINLQSAMVRAGHARAYRFHSKEYVVEQQRSKKQRLGIWQGFHVRPGLFRKCWRKSGSARACSE